MTTSVLIPTYRRPQSLTICLRALAAQDVPPDEIVVVLRDSDTLTSSLLETEFTQSNVRRVIVRCPGQVHALNAGIAAATGDVIAITDDDTAPRPDWLRRMVQHFASDGAVGAVGGRDWVHQPDGRLEDSSADVVGKVCWYGKEIGNHHLGVGTAREVEILKGANMGYRRRAIRGIVFDDRLLGAGAQVRNDMAFSLAVHGAGWKVIYDPEVALDHFPAARPAGDTREFQAELQSEAVHNDTLVLVEYLRVWQRPIFFIWALLIGTRVAPGLLQVPRLLFRGEINVLSKWLATVKGRFAGLRTAVRSADSGPVRPKQSVEPAAVSPRARRVLCIDHTARMGGGEIALLNLVCHLDRARYEPVVLLFSDGPLRAKLEAAGVEVHLLPLDAGIADARKDTLGGGSLLRVRAAWTALKFVLRVRRRIRALNVDIVHTNSLKSDILGGLAARLARKPLIWHVRDRISDDYLPSSTAKVFRWMSRVIPHHVIANSAATLATLGDGIGNAAVVPSGLSNLPRLGVIHDGTHSTDVDRIQGGISSPLVGLVGRLTAWKGQHIFIAAAAQVLRKFPDARFQIIGSAMFGEDAYERQLRKQVAELDIGHAVEFCGFCDDVPQRIAALSVLVHASTTGEPFGQVVIEGMAAGKPVVATDGGGIPEIIENGCNGLLVPMGDARAMAGAIESLLANPLAALKLGSAGRRRVQDRFMIHHTVAAMQKLYARVLDPDASECVTTA